MLGGGGLFISTRARVVTRPVIINGFGICCVKCLCVLSRYLSPVGDTPENLPNLSITNYNRSSHKVIRDHCSSVCRDDDYPLWEVQLSEIKRYIKNDVI